MFGARIIHMQGKTSALMKARQVAEREAPPEGNRFWQSLALRPWGVQAKLASSQSGDPDANRGGGERTAYPFGVREKMGTVPIFSNTTSLLLQRKCGCGSAASPASGQCSGCSEEEEEFKVQTKLKVSEPGDVYEQEADRISDQVMRMPEPQFQRASAGEACAGCQAEQPSSEPERVQTKRIGSSELGQTAPPSIANEVLRSPGQTLDSPTRSFMESRFQHDFSGVRVHTGSEAGELNQSLHARAFTVGNNVVFGKGQYSPETIAGKHLLAHELTHTIQQGWAATSAAPHIQRAPADSNDWGGPFVADDNLKCTGVSRDGPGDIALTPMGWQFRNFDVDKHFLKPEHQEGLRAYAPALKAFLTANAGRFAMIAVFGEASTTAGTTYNLKLSRRRARCVARYLETLGVPASAMMVGWAGDMFSEMRLAMNPAPTQSDIENPDDRRVTIATLNTPPPKEECNPLRPSQKLDFRFGCLSRNRFSVVIADQNQSQPSQPSQPFQQPPQPQPIYREFVWQKMFSNSSDCEFFPQLDPTETHSEELLKPARLAWTLAPDSPSDFSRIAFQRSFAVGADIDNVLGFESNDKQTRVSFPGTWAPASCQTDISAGKEMMTLGILKPVAEVKCGPMPVPKSIKCVKPPEDGDKEGCPPPGRLESTASRFKAETEQVPLTQRVIDFVGGVVEGSEVRYLSIGTKKTADEKKKTGDDIWRPFVFTGKVTHGPEGCEQRDSQGSARGETDIGHARSLSELVFSPATMVRSPNSNVALLIIAGFGDLKLFGEECTSGGTEILRGFVTARRKVQCEPMEMETPPAEKTCKEECPEARRTCADEKFIFRFGRMSPESAPPGLQSQLSKDMGCQVEVAQVNIGTVSTKPIWRPFLWVQKAHPCAFTVNSASLFGIAGKMSLGAKAKLKFKWPPVGIGGVFETDGMSLATKNPDDPEAPSEFSLATELGGSSLTGSGKSTSVSITGVTRTYYKMATAGSPVGWQGTCKSSDTGMLIPNGKVECGVAPPPAHQPAPKDTCPTDQGTVAANTGYILFNLLQLAALGNRTGIVAKLAEKDGTPVYAAGEVVKGARFMGIVYGPTGNHEPVVVVFDMKVLSVVKLGRWIEVQFTILSQPCAYRLTGERIPLRLNPASCAESLKLGQTYSVNSSFTPLPKDEP